MQKREYRSSHRAEKVHLTIETAFGISLGQILPFGTHDDPLRFDERLRDFDYFLAKTARHAQSKLKVLSQLLGEEDVETAIDNISRNTGQFERIRIWRFDRQKPM